MSFSTGRAVSAAAICLTLVGGAVAVPAGAALAATSSPVSTYSVGLTAFFTGVSDGKNPSLFFAGVGEPNQIVDVKVRSKRVARAHVDWTGNFVGDFPADGLQPGDNSIEFIQKSLVKPNDKGLWRYTTVSYYLEDSQAPVAPLTARVASIEHASGTVQLAGKGEPLSTVHVVDTVTGESVDGQVKKNGSWKADFTRLSITTHEFTATQAADGSTKTVKAVLKYLPGLTVAEPVYRPKQHVLHLAGDATAYAKVRITDGDSVCTAVANDAGHWVYDIPDVAPGGREILFQQIVDNAVNGQWASWVDIPA